MHIEGAGSRYTKQLTVYLVERGIRLGRNKRVHLLLYHLKNFYKNVFALNLYVFFFKKNNTVFKKCKKKKKKKKAMSIVKLLTQSGLEKCQISNSEEVNVIVRVIH